MSNKWESHNITMDFPDGRPTIATVQTNGKAFVLSNHEANQGRHVSEVGSLFGDAMIEKLARESGRPNPEGLSLYVEQKQGGFEKLEARTTMLQHGPSWTWNDGKRIEHGDLERQLGTKIKQGEGPRQEGPSHDSDLNKAEMARTPQSQELREAAHKPPTIKR